MKELFDQVREEAERRELPQPAELRARGDRRAARRGAAGAFSLAVVVAGGFIGVRPLLHEQPLVTADGVVSSSPTTVAPGTIAVPDVRGMSRGEATIVLQQQGFKVQVMAASPPPSGSPQAGKVRQQTPVSAKLIPSQTTVTIWVDEPQQATPVCADRHPRQLPVTLFAKADNEICYADLDPLTAITESLPAPCPSSVMASESLVEDRRGFTGVFQELVAKVALPVTLDQTISRYKGNGAKDYLSELAEAIANCQSVVRGNARIGYSMVTQAQQAMLGDQSLLIDVERRYLDKTEAGPQVAQFMVLVVRTGIYVVVVYDKGRQGGRTASETVYNAARTMLTRLTAGPSPAR